MTDHTTATGSKLELMQDGFSLTSFVYAVDTHEWVAPHSIRDLQADFSFRKESGIWREQLQQLLLDIDLSPSSQDRSSDD